MVKPLSPERFAHISPKAGYGGPEISEEVQAMMELSVGIGFEAPCRWNHPDIPKCSGSSLMYMAARRYRIKVHTRCKDGVLYVLRYE